VFAWKEDYDGNLAHPKAGVMLREVHELYHILLMRGLNLELPGVVSGSGFEPVAGLNGTISVVQQGSRHNSAPGTCPKACSKTTLPEHAETLASKPPANGGHELTALPDSEHAKPVREAGLPASRMSFEGQTR
jgi:hypothetical protein